MIGKIGRYELESLSGIGGMGAVYKAFDSQLKRHVAIKEVMSELLRDPRYVQRFEEEARLLAQIADPRVVTVHDFFQEGGKYYMVMEHVEGEPLSTYVKDPRLGAAEIHAILLDIAYGLRAVHRIGVVHRDVKPKNVLMTPDRKVKIADFGIAKLMEKEPTIPEGTAKYLAPEVLEGTFIDGRTDIYSLGILAYELFLGDVRFNALFPEVYGTGGDHDLKWKSWHLDRSKRLKPLNEHGVSISPWLAAVLARAVDKDATVRYQTIDALIKDLEAARGRDVPTRRFTGFRTPPPAPAAVPARKPSPLRGVAVVAASVLALAAGALAVSLLLRRGEPAGGAETRVQSAHAAAEQARRLLQEGRYDLALEAVNEALKWSPSDPALSRLAEEIESRRRAKRAEAERSGEFQKWREEGRRRESGGDWKGAVEAYEKALGIAPADDVRRALAAARARLAPPDDVTPPPDGGGKGVLVLESQPSGAHVFIDGEAQGKTPVKGALLAGGRHRVRLALRYHEDAEFDVEVSGGDVTRRSVALNAAQGSILVVTEPSGARVFLDHDWVDEPSPTKIGGVSAGQHFLWAEKGDRGIAQTVFVNRDETTTLPLKLERRDRPPQVAARERERAYQDALDQAQDRIARKDWAGAAELLEAALKHRDTPEVRQRLLQLRTARAVEEARAREAAGDFDGALAVCEPVLQAGDVPELRLAVARLRDKKVRLLRVPAGAFLLGSDGPDAESDEKPAQQVVVGEFLIDRAEVTNARYAEFLEDLRRTRDHGRCHPGEPKNKDHAPTGWGTPAYREVSPTPDHPVVLVDWFDAWAYAAWAGQRLPTEAEWEKAAGHDPAAGATRLFPWGTEWNPKRCNAEWAFDGFEKAAPVGSFPEGASPCGALDMAGNVWEWCADWYDHAYPAAGPDPLRDPTGPATGDRRVVRGGSWIDGRASLRVTNRLRNLPTDRWDKLGFRCAQDLRR